MRLGRLFILFCFSFFISANAESVRPADSGKLIKLSQDLLYAVKTGADSGPVEAKLSSLTADDLKDNLTDDQARKVFWLDLYNAWYQIFAIRDQLERPQIFKHQGIHFKDFSLSLDDVEHGILRRHRSKYSLGYLPKLFPEKVIRKLAVKDLDYRIHFALNCGARSCPPIAFYDVNQLDQQLEVAAKVFLQNETKIEIESRLIYTTRLMEWFSADFGGKKGRIKILSKYLEQDLRGFQIRFRDYDWSNQLMNFGQ